MSGEEPTPKEIYEMFIGDRGVLITGTDFSALSYGEEYSAGGPRSIAISGRDRSYMSRTEPEDFPRKVEFRLTSPNMPIREASHVPDKVSLRLNLSLDMFVSALEDGGMKFENPEN